MVNGPTRVAALLVLLVVAACTGEEAAQEQARIPTPTPVPVVTEPTPDPTPDAEAEQEALLEELRASRAFVELAEHDRAPSGRWGAFTYTQFGIAADGGLAGSWPNKQELWDSFVPAFRDECLLAGPPATEPMWDGQIQIPVAVTSRWNNSSTEGRGQFVEFSCTFDRNGIAHEKWFGVLIEQLPDGRGELRSRTETFEVGEPEYSTFEEREADVRQRFWDWILTQEVL